MEARMHRSSRKRVGSWFIRMRSSLVSSAIELRMRLLGKLSDTKGQGTTEYAILVGVLVVIAVLAIAMFKDKIQELWNAISDGINGV